MSRAIEAVYERGVFRPRESVSLSEGQVVEVLLPDQAQPAADAELAELMAFAGCVHGGDPDIAREENVARALVEEYLDTHDLSSTFTSQAAR